MASDDKTGADITGVTGGTTGGGNTAETPKTEPATDPVGAPQQQLIGNNNADVEAQQMKTGILNNNMDVEGQQMKTGIFADPMRQNMKTFDCVDARRRFVMLVFSMVGVMLAIVAFMTMLPMVSQNFRIFAFRNSWLFYLAYLFYLMTYYAISCYPSVRKTSPLNYIVTGILVFSMGWMTIALTIHADTEVILIALGMTPLCTGAVIIFAMKTNFDLTTCGPILFLLSLVLGVIFIFALIACLAFHVNWLYTVYSGLAALLMMAYLAYDVQMMIGGKRNEISVNDPFFAAVQIFVDIVQMFWHILQFVQGKQLTFEQPFPPH